MVVYVIRGIGEDEVGLLTVHEFCNVIGRSGVAADESVSSQQPYIPGLGNGRLYFLERFVGIKIILLSTRAIAVDKKLLYLRLIETCEV